jgi:hypothetical protein
MRRGAVFGDLACVADGVDCIDDAGSNAAADHITVLRCALESLATTVQTRTILRA